MEREQLEKFFMAVIADVLDEPEPDIQITGWDLAPPVNKWQAYVWTGVPRDYNKERVEVASSTVMTQFPGTQVLANECDETPSTNSNDNAPFTLRATYLLRTPDGTHVKMTLFANFGGYTDDECDGSAVFEFQYWNVNAPSEGAVVMEHRSHVARDAMEWPLLYVLDNFGADAWPAAWEAMAEAVKYATVRRVRSTGERDAKDFYAVCDFYAGMWRVVDQIRHAILDLLKKTWPNATAIRMETYAEYDDEGGYFNRCNGIDIKTKDGDWFTFPCLGWDYGEDEDHVDDAWGLLKADGDDGPTPDPDKVYALVCNAMGGDLPLEALQELCSTLLRVEGGRSVDLELPQMTILEEPAP